MKRCSALRAATLEETLIYGGYDRLRGRRLLPPIAGGAGFTYTQATGATGLSAAPAATYTAGPTQNNLLVAGVFSDATTVLTMTSTGWTALTSAVGSNYALRLFWKTAGASESSTVTAAAGSAAWAMSIVEYSPGGGTINAPTENAQTNVSGSTQATPTVTPTAGLQALVLCWAGARNANTWSNEQVNSSTTGVNTRDTRSRSGAAEALWDLVVTSTSGSYSGVGTVATATTGGGAIAVFTLAAGATGQELAMVV